MRMHLKSRGGLRNRLLAVVAVVAMVLGLGVAGVTAMAEDGTGDDAPQSNAANEAAHSQTATGADDGTAVSVDDVAPVNAVEPLGAPGHHKKILSNGDGSYTLNLDVTGDSTESTTTEKQPLDISLVLDVSGSMGYCMSGNDPSKNPCTTDDPPKISALQNAVDGFINATATENATISDPNKLNRIALVKFAGDKKDSVGDDTYRESGFTYNNTQIVSELTSDFTGLTAKVNKLKAGGPTQADYGFEKAQESLQNARGNARKVVIFFTDGEPTSSDTFENQVANNAIKASKALKDKGTLVYSIGVFDKADPNKTSDQFNGYMHAVSSNYPNAKPWYRLGERVSDSDYYKTAKTADQLNGIFDSIRQEITTGDAYTNVSITDELSKYVKLSDSVKYEGGTDTGQPDGWHIVTGGVKVQVKEDADAPAKDLDSKDYTVRYKSVAGSTGSTGTIQLRFTPDYKLVKGWTYTLSYDVEVTQAAYDEYAKNGYGTVTGDPDTDIDTTHPTSSGKPGFHSNNQAYLTYTVNGKESTADYLHPVVQVEAATLTLVKKVDNTYAGKWGAEPRAWKLGAQAYDSNVYVLGPANQTDNAGMTTSTDRNVLTQTAVSGPVKAGTYILREDSDPDYAKDGVTATTTYGDKYPYFRGYNDPFDPQSGFWSCQDDDTKADVPTDSFSRVAVKAGQHVTCTVTNKALPGSLTWQKIADDEDQTPLPGSEWTLAGPDSDDTKTTIVDEGENDAYKTGNKNSDGDAIADGKGNLKVDGLKWGKYTLTETKAPDGYTADGKPIEFSVVPARPSEDEYHTPLDPSQPGSDQIASQGIGVAPVNNSLTEASSVRPDGYVLNVDCGKVKNKKLTTSQLPLTGGTTGREWLLAGGGFVLVAGLAGALVSEYRRRKGLGL